MSNAARARIIFHGGIVLLVGLFCGYPTLVETLASGESVRLWHTAHEALIMIGMLMLVMSTTFSALALERREAEGLVWSLLAAGYGFMVGLLVAGFTGAQAFGPSRSPIPMIGFVGNALGILGSTLSALLLVVGARGATNIHRTADSVSKV